MTNLKNHPGFWLRDDAANAFNKAENDHGIFHVNSAGRTIAEQQALINRWDRGGVTNRPPYLYAPARPATASNHVANGGIAIDIANWRDFAAIAANYGFNHLYPSGDPVHFEFVGVQNSGNIPFDQTTADRQNFLDSIGYNLVVDGREGPLTKAAYKRYQTFLRDYGYTGSIDGIWGVGTQTAHDKYWHVLNDAKFSNMHTQIQNGSKGGEVSLWQNYLKTNYPLYSGKLVVDGNFGGNTEVATKEWQRRSGLVPDGIVGTKSWAKSGL